MIILCQTLKVKIKTVTDNEAQASTKYYRVDVLVKMQMNNDHKHRSAIRKLELNSKPIFLSLDSIVKHTVSEILLK